MEIVFISQRASEGFSIHSATWQDAARITAQDQTPHADLLKLWKKNNFLAYSVFWIVGCGCTIQTKLE